MILIGQEEVKRHLDMRVCIGLMSAAMIAVSTGRTRQMPRQAVPLERGMLGLMAGSNGPDAEFGAKVISVLPANRASGRPSHQGGILLFDPATGTPVALVHAGEITAIRTAAASAAATDVLARKDARSLAVLGCGEQAEAHIHAICAVRPIERVRVWGRDAAKRQAFAALITASGIACAADETPAAAVAAADIICATTAAPEPVLHGRDVRPGTHVNLVGSSFAGSAEADIDLVVSARYFADHRGNALAQGGELIRARDAGRVDDAHILAEIGEVFAATHPGRRDTTDITIYKSLGHIAQDLTSAWHVYCQVSAVAGRAIAF